MKQFLKHIIFALGFLSVCYANAQDFNTKIEGQVYSKDGDVAAIHVSNSTRNRGTITDIDGFFTIAAALNDTLVFSAVQFKKKEVVVTLEILKSKKIQILLEETLTQLKEVVVMPYNLSGDISRDMNKLETGPIVTASTEKLPNADFKSPTQSERKLYAARTWDAHFYVIAFTSKLDPLFNYFSGRTKMLNQQVARDAKIDLTNQVRKYYSDSLYINDLKIPKNKINDFIYYCEIDNNFSDVIAKGDKLKIWEFIRKRSLVYRKNNKLD